MGLDLGACGKLERLRDVERGELGLEAGLLDPLLHDGLVADDLDHLLRRPDVVALPGAVAAACGVGPGGDVAVLGLLVTPGPDQPGQFTTAIAMPRMTSITPSAVGTKPGPISRCH